MCAVEEKDQACCGVLEIIENEEMGGYTVKTLNQGVIEWRYCENAACAAHLESTIVSYAEVGADWEC